MKSLVALGPGGVVAAVMFFLWRDERSERRDLAKDNVQLLRDKITSDNTMAIALDKIADRIEVHT